MRVPEIWLSIESKDHIEAFQKKWDSLITASYEELMALPDENKEELETSEGKCSMTIYRTLKDFEIEVILQFYKRTRKLFLLNIARVHAEGFLMNKDGDIRQVSDEKKYGYM